ERSPHRPTGIVSRRRHGAAASPGRASPPSARTPAVPHRRTPAEGGLSRRPPRGCRGAPIPRGARGRPARARGEPWSRRHYGNIGYSGVPHAAEYSPAQDGSGIRMRTALLSLAVAGALATGAAAEQPQAPPQFPDLEFVGE